MTTQAIERVQQWETRSFAGGYRGLHDLADEEFSGVVRATGGTLCMLNGAVVGIVGGTIEDFEDADGTAYEAPSPALPLLIVMQERSDEVRAKYYTEETPLSKVDSTLSDGGFTGFIELSENVLSGDYYVVYHGGRSMSVAFVGESSQLHADEDAFNLADDEVGIYEVRPVDIEPVEIPEPESKPAAATDESASSDENEDQDADRETEDEQSGSQTTASSEVDGPARSDGEQSTADAVHDDSTETVSNDVESASVEETSTAESAGSSEPEPTSVEPTQSSTERADATTATQTTAASDTDTSGESRTPEQRREVTESSSTGTEPARTDPTPQNTTSSRNRSSSDAPARTQSASTNAADTVDRQHPQDNERSNKRSSAASADQSGTVESAADLETRTIPSLDPSRTGNGQETGTVGVQAGPTSTSARSDRQRLPQEARSSNRDADRTQSSRESASDRNQDGVERSGSGGSATDGTDRRVAELRETISQREQRIDSLEEQLESVRSERDDLSAERDELETEVQRLQDELASVREERQALAAQLEELDVDTDRETPERRLGRREALDGTNLFVRYDSKGDPTLQTAYESGAGRKDVNSNLNVESHTQFEREGAAVAGKPFEDFLEGSIEHRFVSWVVRELLFEIRDTGHQDALADLYDALPRMDRAELNGSATVEYTEEGQTKRSQESFDIVLRDRMGNPLVVANINDSRQAASEDQMSSLVTAATRVAESNSSLAGAMFVTSSFFEPGALETAADATSGGLLSRDKRESFVKTSRKQGYHLCLVEARDSQFHMAVPEL